MYKNLRSAKKLVEAILIENKDVEIIQTLEDLDKEKQVETLKRKKETSQKKMPVSVSSKGKSTKRKVISSKVASNKRSNTSRKSINARESNSDSSDSDLKCKKSSKKDKPRKSKQINISSSDTDSSGDEDFKSKESTKKPTSLLEDDKEKVSNQQIFGFQTPKRRNGMLLKAENSMKNSPKAKENLTPKSTKHCTPKRLSTVLMQSPLKSNTLEKKSLLHGNETPKSEKRLISCKTPLSAKFNGKSPRPLKLTCESPTPSEEKENKLDYRRLNLPKTPYSLRTKLKKRISLENKKSSYQDDDSGSEFEASSSESSSESSDDDQRSEDDGLSPDRAPPVQKKPRIILRITNQNESSVEFKPRRGGRKREPSYVFKSDDYFTHKSAKQVNKTSNNTLKKTPQISRDKMATILSSIRDSHEVCKQEMMQCVRVLYPEWLLFLRENFNILLHGFGSKYKVINEFHKTMLGQSRVLVINGFFPDLTLKEILDSIMIDLLEMKEAPQDPQQAFELIKKKLKSKCSTDIFLVIHNIDGVALRGSKQQSLLAQLATLNKVHIIASVDHINAPLLWDNSKLGQLNFVWFDVTNYNKYDIETSYESSLLIDQSSGKLVKSSIVNVYKSLNNNAKQIFLLIVNNHLENKKNKQYQGVSFKDLYSWCRKGFLVTSDLTLRTQLTEFLDHELIKWRNDKEHLYIPINLSILEDFQQKQVECEA